MSFVIIDTSIWIDFFRGRLRSEAKEAVVSFVRSRQAAVTEVIIHEILVGSRNEKQYVDLSSKLSPLHVFAMEISQLEPFHRFGFELNQRGLLGKFTDVSIAFHSVTNGAPVFSLDRYFSLLSSKKVIDSVVL